MMDSIFNRLQDKNGCFDFENRHYVLLQQAYIDGREGREDPYYTAIAVCSDDSTDELGFQPVYQVEWKILPETFEYWGNGGDDEGDACDWKNPKSVVRIASDWSKIDNVVI